MAKGKRALTVDKHRHAPRTLLRLARRRVAQSPVSPRPANRQGVPEIRPCWNSYMPSVVFHQI